MDLKAFVNTRLHNFGELSLQEKKNALATLSELRAAEIGLDKKHDGKQIARLFRLGSDVAIHEPYDTLKLLSAIESLNPAEALRIYQKILVTPGKPGGEFGGLAGFVTIATNLLNEGKSGAAVLGIASKKLTPQLEASFYGLVIDQPFINSQAFQTALTRLEQIGNETAVTVIGKKFTEVRSPALIEATGESLKRLSAQYPKEVATVALGIVCSQRIKPQDAKAIEIINHIGVEKVKQTNPLTFRLARERLNPPKESRSLSL